MSWIEVTLHIASDTEEAVANILNDAGANGVIIEDIRDTKKERSNKFGEIIEIDTSHYPTAGINIKAYFYENNHWPIKRKQLQTSIENLKKCGISPGDWTWLEQTVHEEDWENEWKKYFTTQKITERITIVPSWEQAESTNDMDILMDPGMAFGTGTHPTTILSIQALEKVVQPKDIVLDVGVGSGVLSIAACKLAAEHVYAYDLDEVAIKSAKMNVELNNLTENVTIQQHDLLRNIKQPAKVIVANILADILIQLVEDAWENLLKDGYFITSGIIEEKEGLVKEKLVEQGFKIVEVCHLDHWITIIAQKRNN